MKLKFAPVKKRPNLITPKGYHAISVSEDITFIFSDKLLTKLITVPPKTGKRSKDRRMSVMRHNLIRDALILQRESRRHLPFGERKTA